MTKLKKIFFSVITIFVIIPLLLIFALVTFVNPNNYKETITKIISSSINRQITIDGNLEWNLWPFGINIEKLKIANDPKFKQQAANMIDASNATMRFQLLPALYKSYRINSLTLNDASIILAKEKSGYSNWQSMIQVSDVILAQDVLNAQEVIEKIKHSDLEPKLDLAIKQLSIKNGSITIYNDKEVTKITNVNIDGKDINLTGSASTLSGSLDTNINQSQTTISTKFNTNLYLSNNFNDIKADLKEVLITSSTKNSATPLNVKLSGKIAVNQQNETITINPLTLTLFGNTIQGNAAITNYKSNPEILSSLKADNIKLEKLGDLGQFISGRAKAALDLKTKGDNSPTLLKNLNGKFSFNANNGLINQIDIDKFIELLNAKISIDPKNILNTVGNTLNFVNNLFGTVLGSQRQTKFSSITATGVITNGVINNNDLKVITSKALITGQGNVNLPNESIKYELNLLAIEDPDSIKIPIGISGNLYDPKYKLGMPSGSIVKNNIMGLTKELQKIPGVDKIPLDKVIDALPIEKLDKVLGF